MPIGTRSIKLSRNRSPDETRTRTSYENCNSGTSTIKKAVKRKANPGRQWELPSGALVGTVSQKPKAYWSDEVAEVSRRRLVNLGLCRERDTGICILG
ncbi:hypothetical protein E4G67_04925 [Candidatus Bathyarchaeota archaeon]|nr:MAG: hypothetical protein E4G67_04925 [Candidatus Bathyarchaeota archaeon]